MKRLAELVLFTFALALAVGATVRADAWKGRALETCRVKVVVPVDGPTDLEAFPIPQVFGWCPDGDPYAEPIELTVPEGPRA